MVRDIKRRDNTKQVKIGNLDDLTILRRWPSHQRSRRCKHKLLIHIPPLKKKRSLIIEKACSENQGSENECDHCLL